MVSVPLFSHLGSPPSPGVQRFLVLASLALPLFILGSWALQAAADNPTNRDMVLVTAVALGLAFALLLALFPVFTWVPMLTSQAHPYSTALLFQFLPSVVLMLGTALLHEHGWIRQGLALQDGLRLAGGLLVLTAGALAVMTRHAGQLMGYLILAQNGFSLLGLSLASALGDEITAMLLLPRNLALGLCGLCLAIFLQHSQSLAYSDLRSAVRRTPLAVAGTAMSMLSLAGLPLLAEFPIRYVLVQEIAAAHPVMSLAIMLGWLGLLGGVFRLLITLLGGEMDAERFLRPQGAESHMQIVLITLAVGAILVLGIAPRMFFPGLVAVLP